MSTVLRVPSWVPQLRGARQGQTGGGGNTGVAQCYCTGHPNDDEESVGHAQSLSIMPLNTRGSTGSASTNLVQHLERHAVLLEQTINLDVEKEDGF
jgi:hypothetical protein